ncbi:hypothetical protein F5X68DRAFT_218906 [Plectosphaerella plurivora]|uniref:SANT domain-containing protein n=1 Tax=Plectosphaerella plurivora TaxID=936078 RepID=A0A9P8UY10_9PEZI|nr:hypothetical protein F5X68DRAFT_218906 [Plectosphaerella plurivora]
MTSRYSSSRYDGDRRSRSPRDRSPDRYDRNSQYGGDNDRRRSSVEARSNVSAYQNNRDAFRNDLTREPPRGPKALIDPPSGPRGGGHSGDYRGRGRGRGRGWQRDTSRDRTRDRDIDFRDRGWEREDFRDRRDNIYRDDRSREREREWRDSRDGFRGRRPSPGRGRSPPPMRDFRDRDPPLAVDPDRSRRGSRDGGPPSAGSSNSDAPFGFRGGFRGRGGRGWERGRGRGGGGPGGGGYYDDRDRDRFPPRTRSQEGRWGRDDRDRGGDRPDRGERWPERDTRPDPHDREPPRELFRAKMERAASSQAPSPINTKDVSPPPIAPSAPAFGSVPTRNTGASDAAAGSTTKPPPTGPRAFNSDRPTSSGHPGQGESQGSKAPSVDGNPPIPLGPRSQQQQKPQRPSSKQWINPALAGKRGSESPKVMRSQSFAQQPRPFDFQGESSRTDFSDYDRRPRSSGARSDSRMASPDSQMRGFNAPEPGEIAEDEDDQPSRDTFERDHSYRNNRRDFFRPSASDHQPYRDNARRPSFGSSTVDIDRAAKPTPAPAAEPPAVAPPAPVVVAAPRKSKLKVPIIHFSLPPRDLQATSSDEPSESDDDEDYGEYIATEIAKKEAALQQLEVAADDAPDRILAQYARVSHEAMVQLVSEPEGLVEMLGPTPKEPPAPEEPKDVPVETAPHSPKVSPPAVAEETDKAAAVEAPPTENDKELPQAPEVPEPQPKTEDLDMDDAQPILPELPAPPPAEPSEKTDIPMQDAEGTRKVDTEVVPQPEPVKQPSEKSDQPQLLYPPGEPIETIEHDKGLPTTPSQVDDEEDATTITESDDLDPMILDLVRDVATPLPQNMPSFELVSWNDDKDFLQTLDSDPMIDDFISKELDRVHLIKAGEQGIVRQEYADNYSKYLQFTLSSDPAAARSREKFVSNPPPPDTTVVVPPPPEPKPEGRGTGRRYASERDLERILQESKREEEERKERELRAQQDRFRSEKEAVPPDMYWNKTDRDNEAFVDSSGLVSVEQIASTWHLLPPINNFTEQEAERFEKGYLESIKQWGVIAEGIENRDFKTCIQYYYLMKKELNLKEKLKKQPKRRKKGGRAKTRSSALVSELGNAENENEENPETGENGERRRPRRAAAPTWGYEQPPTDSDNATPAGTPGRRSAKGGEAGPEKPKATRTRRVKDKEPKAPKGQTLVPGAATGSGKGRSRSNSRVPIPDPLQALPPTIGENRLAAQPEGQSAIQPPFPSLQPQQLPVVPERPMGLQGSTINEVMAPPSLRPEPPPPPQPTMTTFDLGQPQPPPTSTPALPQSQPQAERRSHVQPSSYWSVSETDVFPGLLRAFGSDWQAMAAHMGSKTAVMVKNYYVRQRDSHKPEWESLLAEADAKKSRGEKRPDPPAPPTQTGRKKYDATTTTQNRPLASASRELAGDVTPGKMETTPVPTPNQPYGRFPAVPIAQAPPTQQQPQPPQQPQQPQPHQPLAQVPQQPQPLPISQHAMAQPMVTQAMSPNARPLRAPLQQGFGYLDQREREPLPPSQQAVRISQKPAAPEHAPPRTLAAAQPLQAGPPGHQEHMERQKMEMQQPKDMHNPMERTRLPQEAPGQPPQHHPYEPFSLHQRPIHRGDPLAPPARQPQESLRQESLRQDSLRQDSLRQDSLRQESLRHESLRQDSLRQESIRGPLSAPQPFSQQPMQQQPPRGLLGDPSQPQTGTPPAQRPMSTAQRQMVGQHPGDPYPPQQQSPPVPSPVSQLSRPPAQERKTSNLMSLLNDDPPAQPKRAMEPVKAPPPTSTPTPVPMSRPPPGPKPPVGLELRPEGSRAYMPYGESGPPPASGMPSLKPSYTASPQAQHINPPRSNMASPHETGAMERDYYRFAHHQTPQPAPPSSGSPPAHHYPAPSHVSRDSYSGPPQGGYPPYGGPTSHAGSPPPAYAVHQQGSRAREAPPPNRETAWPQGPQGHVHGQPQQQPGWPKQNQPPPQQQSWNSPHGQPGKPQTPAPMNQQPAWAAPPQQQQQPPQQQPPPQSHHLSLREERGPTSMYGQPAPQQHQLQHHQHSHQHAHQHSISGRYPPQSSRQPEPLPPQAQQAFPPRYASTPGPRDPREQIQPPRSYTPGAHFDNRGPPPGPYPPDPREMQLRDMQHRDHREMLQKQQQEQEQQQRQQQQQQHAMMNRQLRPGDAYDRPPDRFSR